MLQQGTHRTSADGTVMPPVVATNIIVARYGSMLAAGRRSSYPPRRSSSTECGMLTLAARFSSPHENVIRLLVLQIHHGGLSVSQQALNMTQLLQPALQLVFVSCTTKRGMQPSAGIICEGSTCGMDMGADDALVAAGQAAVVAGAVHHDMPHVRGRQRAHVGLHGVPALARLPRVARAECDQRAAACPSARHLEREHLEWLLAVRRYVISSPADLGVRELWQLRSG